MEDGKVKFKKLLKRTAFVMLLLSFFIYLNNSSFFTKERSVNPFLLAHRGLGQTFSMEGITGDTCTAERIFEPEHPYLENTIPSIEAAFEAGADMVEFDIRPTKDGQFAVFHDWTLDCRTNVTGEPKEYTMEQLKQVDIGYSYTADNGKTYPFRGKGIGLMPSLEEVLSRFPEQSFLIHIKSNDPEEGVLLSQYLSKLAENQRSKIAVYGGNEPIDTIKESLPDTRVMSMSTMKSCLIPYITVGWSGYTPSTCRKTQVHIPEKVAPWLWGWPNKFLNRMEAVDTRVIVVAGDGSWSEGFDKVEDLKQLPTNYSGGIWTNRIDRIAPVYHGNHDK
ncbi:glycerophosphodiester phosphodiesterase family protein [Metabacillus herbersteinensis]|uniref:Glycerophosphodiester phosphodiesterase family protein n=1 Tax=Metabacillus herbersteinensis TaxID=283816 RepID=A0ABV6GGI8_9BACI